MWQYFCRKNTNACAILYLQGSLQLCSIEKKKQAVGSTGLQCIVTRAMVHLISHYYYQGFGSIKELPGRNRITIRVTITQYLAVTNKL